MNPLFTSTASRWLAFLAAAIALTACGGGGGDSGGGGVNPNPFVPSPPPTFSVTGTVAGLSGSGLTLANGASSIAVSANGNISIASALANGANYSVTVSAQPSNPNQVCTVSNASGAIASANVTNVTVNCVTTPPTAATLTVSFDIKQLKFTWNAVSGATFYRLLQNPDSVSGFTQVGGDLTALSATIDIAVHRHDFPNARYVLDTCNSGGCTSSNQVNTIGAALQTIGYFKASNTEAYDQFGIVLAISGDGNTLAVGAPAEASNATGINGDQNNNNAVNAGAIYIYARSGSAWTQQAYVKASNTKAGDAFGYSIALSNDGNTLAVGAGYESSSATGINGDQNNTNVLGAGAVYVYTRSGSTWTQQAYVKASNTDAIDIFGSSVALSGDGNTLAVGASYEDSNSVGINGDQNNNDATDAGAVYVYTRSGSTWSQQAYVKASNTGAGDKFGSTVALSSDGNTLAVGAADESSNATGINGDQNNNSATFSGAVYVFRRDASITRNAGTWTQQAYVKASNAEAGDYFGSQVALSGDGNTLAVGAYAEDSGATGINGNQVNNSAPLAGAAYVYTRSGSTWTQQAYVKASNTGAGDNFGSSVALSGDGNTLAVCASEESSNATGINGDQSNNSATFSGAVYVYTRSASTWTQQSYVKASNPDPYDNLGSSVALSRDGSTLVVGAFAEDGNATGINGDQKNNSAELAGAVYLY
jgi:hypothetical protein